MAILASMPGRFPALFEMHIDFNQNITYQSRCSPDIFCESELKAHIKEMEDPFIHGDQPTTQPRLCVFCGQFFPATELAHHLKSKHAARRCLSWFFKGLTISSNTYFCSTCPHQTKDIMLMARHISESAQLESSSMDGVIRHEPGLCCIFCGRALLTPAEIWKHLREAHQLKHLEDDPTLCCQSKDATANAFWP